MLKYEVRAFDAEGKFGFGATFRAADDSQAKERFSQLPLRAPRAELYRGNRRVASRHADPECDACQRREPRRPNPQADPSKHALDQRP
jgi:hypothetical protein